LKRRVRLAYYAGITHVDDQVGRLLDGLKVRKGV
jgi:arylsulfatase A-like enzyme